MKKIIILFLLCIFLINSAFAFDWEDGSLMAYYDFENHSASQTFLNDSLGIHNGALTNMEDIDWNPGAGIIGACLEFDGVNESVSLGNFSDVGGKPASYTLSFWLKPDAWGDSATVKSGSNGGGDKDSWGTLMYNTGGDVIYAYSGTGAVGEAVELSTYAYTHSWNSTSFPNTAWTFVVVSANSSHYNYYHNGTLIKRIARAVTNSGTAYNISIAKSGEINGFYFDGEIDEVGIWNRSLTESEINELWNGGSGLTYQHAVDITLIHPTDSSSIPSNHTYLQANYTLYSATYNWTNYTYYVWFSNGTLFNNSINGNLDGITNSSNDTIFLSIGSYVWNTKAFYHDVGSQTSMWAPANYSFTYVPFTENSQTYNSNAMETSYQQFSISITTNPGYDIRSGMLVYNGTSYSGGTTTDLGGGTYSISKSIYIPQGDLGFSSELREFHWNITLVNEATGITSNYNSSSQNQNVTELVFQLCNATINVALINFTLYDEGTGIMINASSNPVSFQATFNIGAYHEEKIKNYSISNLSVENSSFAFCTTLDNNTVYADMESLYSAPNYTEKNYYLTNATLTNSTSNIELYLLNEDDAIEFFIAIEEDLSPVTSATVTIRKYFVGEGVYKTVEIDETSSDTGTFTSYLDLDKKYNFIVTRDGEVLGSVTKTASCKEAPCELTLSLSSGISNVYSVFPTFFAQNIIYTLDWDKSTKLITFDFTDITGLANYFRMYVWKTQYNSSSILVINSTLYTTSGTIIGNLSNYTSGDFKVEVYVSRSPELLIDFRYLAIEELTGTFGILGLFFALLIILTIIFGISLNPTFLILSVPLSLIFGKSIGIISISWLPIIIILVLAAIGVIATRK